MTKHRGPSPDRPEVERAIIKRLLPRLYERRTSLQAALDHIEPSELESALERLQQQGIVYPLTADAVRVSPCAQHLDSLGVIGI
jgi:hypothetical protein